MSFACLRTWFFKTWTARDLVRSRFVLCINLLRRVFSKFSACSSASDNTCWSVSEVSEIALQARLCVITSHWKVPPLLVEFEQLHRISFLKSSHFTNILIYNDCKFVKELLSSSVIYADYIYSIKVYSSVQKYCNPIARNCELQNQIGFLEFYGSFQRWVFEIFRTKITKTSICKFWQNLLNFALLKFLKLV